MERHSRAVFAAFTVLASLTRFIYDYASDIRLALDYHYLASNGTAQGGLDFDYNHLAPNGSGTDPAQGWISKKVFFCSGGYVNLYIRSLPNRPPIDP